MVGGEGWRGAGEVREGGEGREETLVSHGPTVQLCNELIAPPVCILAKCELRITSDFRVRPVI